LRLRTTRVLGEKILTPELNGLAMPRSSSAFSASGWKRRQEGFAWVDIYEEKESQPYRYDRARSGDTEIGGVFYYSVDYRRLNLYEGLVRKSLAEGERRSPIEVQPFGAEGLPSEEDTAAVCAAVRGKPSAPITHAGLVAARQAKTTALHGAVSKDPDTALRIALFAFAHPCGAIRLAIDRGQPPEDRVISDRSLKPLGSFESLERGVRKGTGFAWERNRKMDRRARITWRKLAKLDREELLRLFAATVATTVGSYTDGSPAAGDSSAAKYLAEQLDLKCVLEFELSEEWLKQYRKPRLLEVARECGAVVNPRILSGKTTAEIRSAILTSKNRDPAWLPPELCFGTPEEIARKLKIWEKPQ